MIHRRLLQYVTGGSCYDFVFFTVNAFKRSFTGNRPHERTDQNAIIALVLHLGLLAALMFLFDLNIFAVVIANAAFGLIMCILNAGSIRRYSGYHQEIRKTFFVPAIAAAGMVDRPD